MPFSYKYQKLSDVTLAYIEKGQGEPLILLHGNGENSEYFEFQLDEFSNHFHVYAVNSRAHGKSTRGKKALSLQQIADDLFEFMNALQIEKANILGFSDGGNVALLFALSHQEKIIKLISDGANLDTSGVSARFQIGVVTGHFILKLFENKSSEAKQKREILSLMINQPNITQKQLSTVFVPTLIMAGTKDMIKKKHTEYIAKCISESKLCFVEGGHCVARENPKEFNKAVLDFLL